MNNKKNTIPQSVGQQIKNPTGWDKNLAGKNRFWTYAGMTGKNRSAAEDNVSPDPKGSSLKPLGSWGKDGVGKISTRRVGRKGFTLIEVLVTIVVSSILFIAISNLMASFFRINADIKNTIAINNEKETVHMTLQNFLDEAWRVIHVEKDSPTTGFDKVVLLNKKDSKLLPFTIILADPNGKQYADTSHTNIYNLLIKNVAYTYNGTQWQLLDKMLPRCDSTKKYCLDYWNNAVYYYPSGAQTSGGALDWSFCVNTPYPTGCVDHFCKDDTDTQCIKKPYIDPDPTKTDFCGKNGLDPSKACILVGYKHNKLIPGTTAFAPFIEITKPTDIKINGTTINILSPYEGIEYTIDLTGNNYSITSNNPTAGSPPTPIIFPYYYFTGTPKKWIDKDTTLFWQISKGINNFTKSNISGPIQLITPLPTLPSSDIRNTFGLITLKYIKSVYGTPVPESSKDSIDQIQYTLVDPMYTKDGKSGNNDPIGNTTKQSSSFLFKTSKIN